MHTYNKWYFLCLEMRLAKSHGNKSLKSQTLAAGKIFTEMTGTDKFNKGLSHFFVLCSSNSLVKSQTESF